MHVHETALREVDLGSSYLEDNPKPGLNRSHRPLSCGRREKTSLLAFLTVLPVLKIPEATKFSSRTGISPYILLHCCTAVVSWSVGSGGVVGGHVGR